MNDNTRVTADEAAIQIRQSGFLDDAHHLTPAERHRANFAGRVCEILGLESTAENMAKVQTAMDRLDIEPHEGHEYPKWVPTGKKIQVYDPGRGEWVDGPKDEMRVANDADEEAMIGRGETPEPRADGYGTFQGEPPVVPNANQPLFGLKPRLPTDTVPPSQRGADGAKAASGTYDQGRGPPLPPGYPNTGGRFLDENSPDRGLPGYPNAGTGRDESLGPDQRTVLPAVEGDPHPDMPPVGGASNEQGYSGGDDDIMAPHAGPEGFQDTGSKETDVQGATFSQRDEDQRVADKSASDRKLTEQAEADAKEAKRRQEQQGFTEAGAGRLTPKPAPTAPTRAPRRA